LGSGSPSLRAGVVERHLVVDVRDPICGIVLQSRKALVERRYDMVVRLSSIASSRSSVEGGRS